MMEENMLNPNITISAPKYAQKINMFIVYNQ